MTGGPPIRGAGGRAAPAMGAPVALRNASLRLLLAIRP